MKRLDAEDSFANYRDICVGLSNLKNQIDEGFEKGLKQQLDENTQKVFIEINKMFERKKWFNDDEFTQVANKFKLNEEQKSKIIDDLKKRKLIEKRFYF